MYWEDLSIVSGCNELQNITNPSWYATSLRYFIFKPTGHTDVCNVSRGGHRPIGLPSPSNSARFFKGLGLLLWPDRVHVSSPSLYLAGLGNLTSSPVWPDPINAHR